MGVDVDPEVMIGISFNSRREAVEFIEDNFSNDQELFMRDEDFDDLHELAEHVNLEWQEISGYTDYGGVIGESVGPNDLYGDSRILEIWDRLKSTIPDEFHEKIQPHIWARYW